MPQNRLENVRRVGRCWQGSKRKGVRGDAGRRGPHESEQGGTSDMELDSYRKGVRRFKRQLDVADPGGLCSIRELFQEGE